MGDERLVPSLVAARYRAANIVVFSSAIFIRLFRRTVAAAAKQQKLSRQGEYAMSCLARERMFEYGAKTTVQKG